MQIWHNKRRSAGLMNMASIRVKVHPNAIEFTQNSVAPNLTTSSDERVKLEGILKMLKSCQLRPDEFPPLEVSFDEDGVLCSPDHRRLWLFREAGISEITVELLSKPLYGAPPRSARDQALKKPKFVEVKVNPNALRFSQDSIARYMTKPSGEVVSLEENLKMLKSGQLFPENFPPLEVSIDEDGVVWSNDNKRLWLFRMAGIPQITVKLSSKPLFRAPPRHDDNRALMSKSDFFPKVRGQSHTMDDDTEASLTEAVVKVNPYANLFPQSSSVAGYLTSPGRSRNQYFGSESTSTQQMVDDSSALLTGAVAAASAIAAGYAWWKCYKQSKE